MFGVRAGEHVRRVRRRESFKRGKVEMTEPENCPFCGREPDTPTEETDELERCPVCGKLSVRAKGLGEGGGVECITPGCGYWFCY